MITEMPDGNAIVRFKRRNELRPWITMFPQGGNVTDISSSVFPSNLQNMETHYFVLC